MIFIIPLEKSGPDLLISYVNQSFMRASDVMKELDGFNSEIKPTEGLHLKGFESVLHPIPGLIGCCIFHEADLDCFDEDHPQNSSKRWLTDEILNFYI